MKQLDPSSPSDGYYPQTMIDLCVISYDDMSAIPDEVSEQTDLKVVWGPAQLVSDVGISYSAAFIAMRPNPEEYTLVIRGTNMDSWTAWTSEDFEISPPLLPFYILAPHAPASALISRGTYNGMCDLLALTDPTTGQTLTSFLKQVDPETLFITGHSLGGTLTPPMFAYLNDFLYGGGPVNNMGSYTFAGLTPGDQGFANYFNGLTQPTYQNRFFNTLDIAPFCWWSLSGVQNIYNPWDLSWGFPESDFIETLFGYANGGGYTQPLTGIQLPGVFNTDIVDEYFWTAQAMYQHESTTYQTLIYSAFPLAEPALR